IARALIVTALNAVDFGKLMGTAQSGFQKATGGVTSVPGQTAPQGAQAQTAPQGQPGQQGQAGQTGQPGQQGRPSQGSTGANVPEMLASVVYALIMIVVSIAALESLKIASTSALASQVLTSVLTAIPRILVAVVLVGFAVLIVEGASIDGWLIKQEILPEGSSITPTVLRIVEIAVVLFFAVMGAQVLGFPQVTAILSAILELGGSVLSGGAIIVAGFFIAMIIGRILSGTVSTVVRWAVIILFTAMGLQSMGVADSIIEMAFGALVIGGAAAAVLAFGLGGREAAARQLAKLEK